MVVWKFDIEPDKATITMPQGAQLIHVEEDKNRRGVLCLWAECNKAAIKVERRVIAVMTGVPRDTAGLGYIGSAWLNVPNHESRIMVHVYDGGEVQE